MRLELWERRLADLVVAAQQRDFKYGTFDCCLWACDAVVALTGADPGATFRGLYSTEEEASAILEAYDGLDGLVEKIAAERGFLPMLPSLAQRGDVVLARITGRYTLGVCIGVDAAFPRQPSGLTYLLMISPEVKKAWRVE